MNVREIFHGSDGEATKLLYAELEKRGHAGVIALNLFRAQKASARAKVYRRKFKGVAYDKKGWSLQLLCAALSNIETNPLWCSHPGCAYPDGKPCHGCGRIASHGVIDWGWKEDPQAEYHKWVLYVDLIPGQVSFHAAAPLHVRRYRHEWDGRHLSAERIIHYVDSVLTGKPFVYYTDVESGNLTSREVKRIAEHLKQTQLL